MRAVFESGALTMGPKVEELEALVARPAASSTPSRSPTAPPRCTSPCSRSGSEPGDEVIVPAYTFPSTANVVRLAGATPVLADVDPATFNLDVAKVYDAVTPRTKAVLAVHLFGRPLDWEALQSAVPPDVLLLEDAAGALGAKWRGMPCGGLGAMGCLSFHPRKVVTTGEGGAVTTNDEELAGVGSPPAPPRARSGRRHCQPVDELPPRGHPLRDRDPAAAAPGRAARGADADRGRLRGAARGARRPSGRRRGRRARLAGVRDPARPEGGGAGGAARGGDRGADRHLRAAPALRLPRAGAVSGSRRGVRPCPRAAAALPA